MARSAEGVPWCVKCHAPAGAEGDDPDGCPSCAEPLVRLAPHPEAASNAQTVYARLKSWQRQQARVQGAEPFMVMPNKALAALSAVQPETLERMRAVPGVGPKKARDYGAVLLRFFRKLHEGEADAQPLVARAPMPEGLTEAEQEEVIELREAARPLSATAQGRGLDLPAYLAQVASLVEKGAVDLPHIYCSPAEVTWVMPLLEGDPAMAPEDLRARLPEASVPALHLLPALARFRRSRDAEEREAAAGEGMPHG